MQGTRALFLAVPEKPNPSKNHVNDHGMRPFPSQANILIATCEDPNALRPAMPQANY